ncbi:MAG: aminopeptidase P N-terminal domain-containing protein [Opitutaceae bacterium]
MNPDLLAARRARLTAGLPLADAVLLVHAGEPVPLPEGSDQTYPYRAHAEYLYAAGEECAGGVVAFDPRGGAAGWRTFVPPVTEAEKIWEGRQPAVGTPLGELQPWLEARRGRPVVALGASTPAPATEAIREAFTELRRAKDGHELALIRRAVDATAAGHALASGLIRPGFTERQLQIELEAEFRRRGAQRTGYGTIVGTGANSAVLHFAPSGREIREGDFVLIDAGAEVERYVADVTRTHVAGRPTPLQRDLHQTVVRALERAIARSVPGAEWKAIHLAAAVDLVEGLVAMGVMRGDPATLVERDAHTLFFPHGLGHMLGLGVRDASGLAPGRRKDPRPSLRSLRMDLPLAAGMVVTVEPGLYFIPPLLQDPARRAKYAGDVNWELVDRHLHLGGVRVEDDILITNGAPEVLTRMIPRGLA